MFDFERYTEALKASAELSGDVNKTAENLIARASGSQVRNSPEREGFILGFIETVVELDIWNQGQYKLYLRLCEQILDEISTSRQALLLSKWVEVFEFWLHLSLQEPRYSKEVLVSKIKADSSWFQLIVFSDMCEYSLTKRPWSDNFTLVTLKVIEQFSSLSSSEAEGLRKIVSLAPISPLKELHPLVSEAIPTYGEYLTRRAAKAAQRSFQLSLVENVISDEKYLAVLRSAAPNVLGEVVVAHFKIDKELFIFTDDSVSIISQPGMIGSKSKCLVMHKLKNQVEKVQIGDKTENLQLGWETLGYYDWTLNILGTDGTSYFRILNLGQGESAVNQNRQYWSRILNKIAGAYTVTTDGGRVHESSGYTLSFGIGRFF